VSRRTERGSDQLERLARPLRRGAEDKLRLDSEPDEVPCDPLYIPEASWRQRPLIVGQGWVGPARLGMPQQVQGVHRRLVLPLQSDRRAEPIATIVGSDSGDLTSTAAETLRLPYLYMADFVGFSRL